MPRRQPPGHEPKHRRTRDGCWQCKERKIKCDEAKPACASCVRHGEDKECDYQQRLQWGGRPIGARAADKKPSKVQSKKRAEASNTSSPTSPGTPIDHAAHFVGYKFPPQQHQMTSPVSGSSFMHQIQPTSSPTVGNIFLQPLQQNFPMVRSPFLPEPQNTSSPIDGSTFIPTRRPTIAPLDPNIFPSTPPHNHNFILPEVRRISVESLVTEMNTYGIDRGLKDLDIPMNDDNNAISLFSPVPGRATLVDLNAADAPFEFGFGIVDATTGQDGSGYYEKPVRVCIPKALELPAFLLENPMNLLYFHHFINHTAGCLVPHNCSSNPFKVVLPEMAVQDPNLMNLLLAYSASHRARLLRQPEPAKRIALWVKDIFPNLRDALQGNGPITNAHLATAIMLASLEIISPSAFGVSVPWQAHLDMARAMISARGGPQSMRTESRSDKVSSFLWSWFTYLDVLGSLSGGRNTSGPVTASSHWSRRVSQIWVLDYDFQDEMEYQIDCILGFTSKCIRVLAKVAELSRVCDSERLVSQDSAEEWCPSEEIVTQAYYLEQALNESRQHAAKPCTHMRSTGETAYQWDIIEIAAVNEAFHWAGAVHLHRRILGKPSDHQDVQAAVKMIFSALYKVRKGSSAEACLLFPMFTAGCEADIQILRDEILTRLKGVERFGMAQVRNARQLMERVWQTGKAWETLVAGEFFG